MFTNATTLLARPPLRAAVEAALNAGVFYEDAFKIACRPAWDAETPALDNHWADVTIQPGTGYEDRRAAYKRLKGELAAAPRGTWAVIIEPWAHSQASGVRFEAVMSDGYGDVATRSDGWSKMPTFAEMLDRMVGSEIYTARKAVEEERRTAAARARMATLHIAAGVTLRNLVVSGRHRFSTAIVTSANPATGSVELHATRRGSKHRYKVSTSALAIELELGSKSVVVAALQASDGQPFALA